MGREADAGVRPKRHGASRLPSHASTERHVVERDTARHERIIVRRINDALAKRIEQCVHGLVAEPRFPVADVEHDAPVSRELAVVGGERVEACRLRLRCIDAADAASQRDEGESVEAEAPEERGVLSP